MATVLRKLQNEALIEEAIETCSLVSLKTSSGLKISAFAPHVLYWRDTGVFVAGCVLSSPSSEIDRSKERDIEVGRITLLKMRDEQFTPYDPFRGTAAKYRDGVLKAVDS